MNQQLSKFETYLLDEEYGLEENSFNFYGQQDSDINNLDEFPDGFFTSL